MDDKDELDEGVDTGWNHDPDMQHLEIDVNPEAVNETLKRWTERAFDNAWANAKIVTSDTQQHFYRDHDHEPFVAEMRAEMLMTKAGWIEFCRRIGDGVGIAEANPLVRAMLEAFPPPRIWWQRATATTGVSIDVSRHASITEEWDESILTIEVSLTDPTDLPGDGWLTLDNARHMLVEATHAWAVNRAPLDYMNVEVRWNLLSGANDCTVHVDRAIDMFVMTGIAIDEATERVWIAVPWWREDNSVGRLILERTIEAARRGCDVRVITRPPTGQYDQASALRVIEQLQRHRNARVAFNASEHAKIYIADDVSVLGSANLTWSDERNENSGTLTVGQATRQRAQAFQRQWEGLAAADPRVDRPLF